MIFVDGNPFSSDSSSSQGSEDLIALLEHPFLVAASNTFKAIPEINFTLHRPTSTKHVYVFQREYATVDPALVELVGTDEATTCVGIVIRNQKTGLTSVAHMDSPKVVDLGLTQMLSLLIDHNSDTDFDVHIMGAFEVAPSTQPSNGQNGPESYLELDKHSFPLCSKIIEALRNKRDKFHIQTLFVLGHNTKRDSDGIAYPIFNGLVVETCTGSVRPASFDRSSRCPDEDVRRLRVTVSGLDPKWEGKLLDTYDTLSDQFQISACSWSPGWRDYAISLLELDDSEFLLNCSTSPSAEGPDFVYNQKRMYEFLVEHPNWREIFPMRKPRMFKRTADGGWIRAE